MIAHEETLELIKLCPYLYMEYLNLNVSFRFSATVAEKIPAFVDELRYVLLH